MLTMEDYTCKSPEKSSPSFPEDADDDEENFLRYDRPLSHDDPPPSESPTDHIATDITMVAEDDDDEMDAIKPISSGIDSPKPILESSDKKVHWTTRNVQALLDCVEEHLHEFNVQKKHKSVWQAIGIEMEPLGFSTEHCYNKWKNLRRDVRLLVNNPSKAVRNASILRRVARLILVIYPNVDATTMQVCGDRSGVKSTPVTPGGPGSTFKSSLSDARFSGLNSPHYKPEGLSRLNKNLYNITNSLSIHSTPNTVEKSFGMLPTPSFVPGTALFGNTTPCSVQNDNADNHSFNNIDLARSQNSDIECTPATSLPFPFNPAAAALLLHSQLFSDLVKQQRKQEDFNVPDHVQDLTSMQNGNFNALKPPISTNSTEFPTLPGISTASLTASLLNGLVGLTTGASQIPDTHTSTFPNLLERLSSSSEIASVVERLQAEEAVHFRLTDMISHLADELRAAGQRRQATLNNLLNLMKSIGISGNSQAATADAGGVT